MLNPTEYEKTIMKTRGNILYRPVIILFCLAAFWLSGCAEKLNIIDQDEFPYKEDTGTINSADYSTVRVQQITGNVVTGFSYFLPVGNYEGYRTRAALRFWGVPQGINVLKSTVTLYGSSVYGDPQDVIIRVYKITSQWYEDDVDPLLEYEIEQIASFTPSFDSTAVDTFSIPTELAQEWVDSKIDTTIPNHGILLEIEAANFTKEYFSRESGDFPPVLTLTFLESGVEEEYNINASKDLFQIQEVKPLPADAPVIDHLAGAAVLVKLEDLGIPLGSTINSAILAVPVDYENSLHSDIKVHSLSAYSLTSDYWLTGSVVLDSVNSASGIILSDTVKMDVTSLIADWISITSEIRQIGFILKSSTEGSDIGRYSLSPAANGGFLSPKLEIMYTIPPKYRF